MPTINILGRQSMRKVIRNKKRYAGLFVILSFCAFSGCGVGDDSAASLVKLEDVQEEIDISEKNNSVETDKPSETADFAENDSHDRNGLEDTDSDEGDLSFTVTISAAGDVTLGNHHQQDYYYSFAQEYDQCEDKAYFFENVSDVFSGDDMTVVNLEGPLTTSENMREDQTYCIKGAPEYAHLLTLGSIEAVGFANNHRMDYGNQGVDDTIQSLEQEGIIYSYDSNVGMYTIHKSDNISVNIGMISVNEINWGAGVEKLIQDGIEELKSQMADIILVQCHWGTEREYYPEDYQQTLGRKCIDWGADLVLGSHPHVLQGVEKYNGKYIVYSLGNFCFGANRNPDDKDTMIVQQTFTFEKGVKQDGGQLRVIPCSVSSVSTRNNFQPTPSQGEEATRIINKLNELSLPYGVSFDSDGYACN